MTEQERYPQYKDAPEENFRYGFPGMELDPWFGNKESGKVWDMWVVDDERIMLGSDRISAYDSVVGLVRHKGVALNLISAKWMRETADIFPNHFRRVLTPEVSIVTNVAQRLPLEVVTRRYLERRYTTTSLWYKYTVEKRRKMYGITLPDDLAANEALPQGLIFTVTTKESGEKHDEEVDDEYAKEVADDIGGPGTWEKIKDKIEKKDDYIFLESLKKGLIVASNKSEVGFDEDGEPILIDEASTPDTATYWDLSSYTSRFLDGMNPIAYGKDPIRLSLKEKGYTGEGLVPVLDRRILEETRASYAELYFRLTGEVLPSHSSRRSIELALAANYFYPLN